MTGGSHEVVVRTVFLFVEVRDAEPAHNLAHLGISGDVVETLGEELLRDHVRISRAQLREYRLTSADHLGVRRARDRVAQNERVGGGRVLHAAQHGEFTGGGHTGLAQVRGVVHLGDRRVSRVDCTKARQDQHEQANRELNRPARRLDVVVGSAFGEDPLQGPCPRGVDDANDGSDADRHEDGQRDIFDAHDATGVLVPGGQQVGAQRRIGRVRQGGEGSKDHVGEQGPERQGLRLLLGLLDLRGRGQVPLPRVHIHVIGESGARGGKLEGIRAAEQQVQARGRRDADDQENELDDRPLNVAGGVREGRVGQEGVHEGFAPVAAFAVVATHGPDLRRR